MSDFSFIKENRKKLKITQQQLGDQVGVSAAYIQQLENNIKQNPSLELLVKIMVVLGFEQSSIDKLVQDYIKSNDLNININVDKLEKTLSKYEPDIKSKTIPFDNSKELESFHDYLYSNFASTLKTLKLSLSTEDISELHKYMNNVLDFELHKLSKKNNNIF